MPYSPHLICLFVATFMVATVLILATSDPSHKRTLGYIAAAIMLLLVALFELKVLRAEQKLNEARSAVQS